jgi:hypothetical protein
MVIGWTVYLHAWSLGLNPRARAAQSQPGPVGTELTRVSSEPGSASPRACGWPGPRSKTAYQSLRSCMRWAMYEWKQCTNHTLDYASHAFCSPASLVLLFAAPLRGYDFYSSN